jgi:hypothetical protein
MHKLFRFFLVAIFAISNTAIAQISIGVEENNIIFRGLANPVSVACGNSDSFFIKEITPGLEWKMQNGILYLDCKNVQTDSAFITFQRKQFNQSKSFVFQVKNVPNPTIRWGAIEIIESSPALAALMVQNSLNAILENFIVDGIKCTVIGFDFVYFDKVDEKLKSIHINGNSLHTIKPYLKTLESGDYFTLKNIEINVPSNVYKHSDITVRIK